MDVQDNQIKTWVDGRFIFGWDDPGRSLAGGGIALVCEEGRIGADLVSVMP